MMNQMAPYTSVEYPKRV